MPPSAASFSDFRHSGLPSVPLRLPRRRRWSTSTCFVGADMDARRLQRRGEGSLLADLLHADGLARVRLGLALVDQGRTRGGQPTAPEARRTGLRDGRLQSSRGASSSGAGEGFLLPEAATGVLLNLARSFDPGKRRRGRFGRTSSPARAGAISVAAGALRPDFVTGARGGHLLPSIQERPRVGLRSRNGRVWGAIHEIYY